MKKILSIFLLLTLLFNLLSIAFVSSLNSYNFNDYKFSWIRKNYISKKHLRKIKRRKIINSIKCKEKLISSNNIKPIKLYNDKLHSNLKIEDMNIKLIENQKTYYVFKKRWCGYWKICISQQDWKKALKIIKIFFSSGIKIAKLTKIIAVDLTVLFAMQNQLVKVTIATIVAIILKLIEEGFNMVYAAIKNSELATQVIIKFWMAVPFWISFR